MGRRSTEPRAAQVHDRDHDAASELRRVREQLFILADAARAYRDLVLQFGMIRSKSSHATTLLNADTELRDVLVIVARMKRFN